MNLLASLNRPPLASRGKAARPAESASRRGFTLVEMVVVLAIMGLAIGSMAQATLAMGQFTQDKLAAWQQRQVGDAVRNYVIREQKALDAVLTVAAGSDRIRIGLSELRNKGYLNPAFADTNAFGQRFAAVVRKIGPQRFQTPIVTTGGGPIPNWRGSRIVSLIGADGGFVYADSSANATGAFGGWELQLSNFSIPPAGGDPGLSLNAAEAAGRLASSTLFNGGTVTANYLHRYPIDGQSEANRMYVNLDMGGNDVSGADQVAADHAVVEGVAITRDELNTIDNFLTTLRDACIDGQVLALQGGRLVCRDVPLNMNRDIFSVVTPGCFWGGTHSISATCPSGSVLISCSGVPGDLLEINEGYMFYSHFDQNRCELVIRGAACEGEDERGPADMQQIIAYCQHS